MSLSIVLVKPEIPENVGFVVRSMKCYNLDSLIIVGREKYPEFSKAHKTGVTAVEILEKAEYVPDLETALKPFHTTLGFSKRHREMSPRRLAKMDHLIPTLDFNLNTALVFGPEAQGLSKDDCLLMDRIVKINLPNPSLSLNLSHAVTLVLQDIWTHCLASSNPFTVSKAAFPDPEETSQPSQNGEEEGEENNITFGQKEFFYNTLKDQLLKTGIISGEKTEAKLTYLKELWHRVNPNQYELDFLMGLINSGKKKSRT